MKQLNTELMAYLLKLRSNSSGLATAQTKVVEEHCRGRIRSFKLTRGRRSRQFKYMQTVWSALANRDSSGTKQASLEVESDGGSSYCPQLATPYHRSAGKGQTNAGTVSDSGSSGLRKLAAFLCFPEVILETTFPRGSCGTYFLLVD